MLDQTAHEKQLEEESGRLKKDFLASSTGKYSSGFNAFTPDKMWGKSSNDAKRHKKESALRFKRPGGN